jgi:predicted metal-dependent enzyme (double-stranded beta helix superfamily)
MTPAASSKLQDLIAMLDDAVETSDPNRCCHKVKNVLEQVCEGGEDFIENRFLQPHPEKYARRLVHKDPAGRYTLLAMVWGVGQGTPLHDHAGMWCCECVYRGTIKVVSYDLHNDEDDPVLNFTPEREILAGVGKAGALIPPFDYHTIENAEADKPAVTLHVYGGELTWCHAFLPKDGGFEKVRRELSYTD